MIHAHGHTRTVIIIMMIILINHLYYLLVVFSYICNCYGNWWWRAVCTAHAWGVDTHFRRQEVWPTFSTIQPHIDTFNTALPQLIWSISAPRRQQPRVGARRACVALIFRLETETGFLSTSLLARCPFNRRGRALEASTFNRLPLRSLRIHS